MRSHGKVATGLFCPGVAQNPYVAELSELPPMIRGLIAPEQKYKLLDDMEDDLWQILQNRYDGNSDLSMFNEPLKIIGLCQRLKKAFDWAGRDWS